MASPFAERKDVKASRSLSFLQIPQDVRGGKCLQRRRYPRRVQPRESSGNDVANGTPGAALQRPKAVMSRDGRPSTTPVTPTTASRPFRARSVGSEAC
jgi:hypothetical protein